MLHRPLERSPVRTPGEADWLSFGDLFEPAKADLWIKLWTSPAHAKEQASLTLIWIFSFFFFKCVFSYKSTTSEPVCTGAIATQRRTSKKGEFGVGDLKVGPDVRPSDLFARFWLEVLSTT